MARPPKPLDPDRSALHWLGHELRRWRTLRDSSQKALGNQIGFSRVYVSLVETAQERPARQFVERCDQALEAGGRLLAVYEHVAAEQAGARLDVPALRARASSEWDGGSPLELGDHAAQSRDMEWPASLDEARRQAVRLWAEDLGESTVGREAASATTAVALRWLVMPRDGSAARAGGWRRVGTADVERLRGVRRDLKTLDNTHGGGAAFPMAVAYLRSEVAPLLQGRYDDATGRALLAGTAELKLDVGWMAYDAGDHALANRYMTSALRLAHATGDRLFGGRVLAAMSSPVSTSLRDQALVGAVVGGVVGDAVLPAAPDHSKPRSGQDVHGVGWRWPRARAWL
jgi:transcriptional regulator with XRE-family HTH domain